MRAHAREREGEGREREIRRRGGSSGRGSRWGHGMELKEGKGKEREPDTRTSRMKIYRDARSSNNHVVECRRKRRRARGIGSDRRKTGSHANQNRVNLYYI